MDIKARALLLARLAIAGSIFGIVLAVVVAWQGLWLSCAITSGGAIASALLATLCYRSRRFGHSGTFQSRQRRGG
jgi:uncharacterized membrane protein